MTRYQFFKTFNNCRKVHPGLYVFDGAALAQKEDGKWYITIYTGEEHDKSFSDPDIALCVIECIQNGWLFQHE